MKKLLFNIALLALGQQAFAQSIAQVRNLGIGQTVTVSGVVTNGSELGPIRYLQDGTAGIACYGTNLNTIQKGDSITATGVLFEFSGLLELSFSCLLVTAGLTSSLVECGSVPCAKRRLCFKKP